MLIQIGVDHLVAVSGPHCDGRHSAAFREHVAGRGIGHHLGTLRRLALDGRLHPAEGVEILPRNQRENMDTPARFARADRCEAQRGLRLLGLVHHHQIDAHVFVSDPSSGALIGQSRWGCKKLAPQELA